MTDTESPKAGSAPLEGVLTLTDWMSSRTDEQLTEMLRLRPDLTVPPPATLDVLAGRSQQRASVLRAAEDLDTLALTVLEFLALERADENPVPRSRLDSLVGKRATKKSVTAALEVLRSRALVRGTTDLTMVPSARDAVPWRVGRILDAKPDLTAEKVDAALAAIEPRERELLTTLAKSSSIGRTKDAAPGTPPDRPVQRLLAAGLLTWLDENTVELPQQVSQTLRGEPVSDPSSLTPPVVTAVSHPIADVDATAAGEALDLLRQCAGVLDALGSAPAPTLKAGGLGVRELRRVAKSAEIDETRVALVVELLAAAGLIASGMPDPPPPGDSGDDMWAPTPAVETWTAASPAKRWNALATGWLDAARLPWLIGMRDANDKPVAALSDEARSTAAPRDRRVVLGVLADLRAGESIDASDLVRTASWRRPRIAPRLGLTPVTKFVAEATTLGIVARGALSSPGRALLRGTDAAASMHAAMPEPIDYVLVQADLTVVAPGPLTPELHQTMALIADVESAGAATMFRLGETSLRRALDAGMSAAELHALFEGTSRTPVPQALTYLIDDVARRHGRLRAGVASAFVRCEDPALLAEVLASPAAEPLALRALAPTVAISQAPLADVLAQLRAAGFAPAGEDSSGTIVDVSARGARVVGRRARPLYRTPAVPTDEQLVRLVGEMRAGTKAGEVRRSEAVRSDGTRASGAATIALLQRAAASRSSVSIGYVDAAGVSSNRVVEPVSVGGGQLDAWDPAANLVRHFTLHRITSVSLLG
ncbi:helicase-associated domain-containing protein [Actinomycetes bacterium M1A6_2h]